MKFPHRLIAGTEGLLHRDFSTLVKFSTKGSGLAAIPDRGLLLLFASNLSFVLATLPSEVWQASVYSY